MIHALAGNKPIAESVPDYPGYPLVADAHIYRWWFYLTLPLLFLLGAWRVQRPAFLPQVFRGIFK